MKFLIRTSLGSVKIGGNILIISAILMFLLLSTLVFAPSGNDYASGSTFLNATITQFVSITPSTALTENILFDTVYPASSGNPARNNSEGAGGGTQYNLTVDSSTTGSINFWNKIAALTCTGGNCYVNESASTTDETTGWSSNTTVGTSISIMGNSTVNCTSVAADGNCWIRYYLDVSTGVTSGNYSTTYTYCGNSTAGSAECT